MEKPLKAIRAAAEAKGKASRMLSSSGLGFDRNDLGIDYWAASCQQGPPDNHVIFGPMSDC